MKRNYTNLEKSQTENFVKDKRLCNYVYMSEQRKGPERFIIHPLHDKFLSTTPRPIFQAPVGSRGMGTQPSCFTELTLYCSRHVIRFMFLHSLSKGTGQRCRKGPGMVKGNHTTPAAAAAMPRGPWVLYFPLHTHLYIPHLQQGASSRKGNYL